MLILALIANSEGPTQTSQAITFSLIAAFVTILTIVLNNRTKAHAEKRVIEQSNLSDERANNQFLERERIRLKEKQEDLAAQIAKEERDYARQDEVASRVENATKMTLRKLSDVEDLGKVTHALVNSDKTAQMQDQRDGWIATLALMREIADLKNVAGTFPSPETKKAMDDLVTRIQTLQDQIDNRLAQQLAAEQRIELDLAQADAASDAANRQIIASEQQQAAADSQQAVANQITEALATQQVVADQVTAALDQSLPPPTAPPPPPPPPPKED